MEFKGNWKIESEHDGKKCFWIDITDENGKIITEVKGFHYGVPNEEARTNAKIIADSPLMLAYIIKKAEEGCDEAKKIISNYVI